MNACPVVRCHPLSDTATTFPSWAVPTFESPSQLGLLTSDISSQAGTQRALYLRVQPLLPVTCMQFCFNGTGSSGFQGRAGDMGIYLCDHREAITRVGGEDFTERLLWRPHIPVSHPSPCSIRKAKLIGTQDELQRNRILVCHWNPSGREQALFTSPRGVNSHDTFGSVSMLGVTCQANNT